MSKHTNFYKCVLIDGYSSTPKYLQLGNSILKALEAGKISKNEVVPSINDLSCEYEISRDTAEKAYRYLKSMGILGSVPGKGYFVKSTEFIPFIKIFLLFNKLSAHKKIIYDSFVSTLGTNASIDFYIYNNDYNLFKKLLLNISDNYSHYVIIPHFKDGGENAHNVINNIPKGKLILLDKSLTGVTGEFGAAYENFEKDIYYALRELKDLLIKYATIKLIFPINNHYPLEITKGFTTFCQDYAFSYEIIHDIAQEQIVEGQAFISVLEEDLVLLIEKVLESKLQIGSQIGIISYNETPIKKIILNGITTISTDFQKMGETAANLILQKSKQRIEIPFKVTVRQSL